LGNHQQNTKPLHIIQHVCRLSAHKRPSERFARGLRTIEQNSDSPEPWPRANGSFSDSPEPWPRANGSVSASPEPRPRVSPWIRNGLGQISPANRAPATSAFNTTCTSTAPPRAPKSTKGEVTTVKSAFTAHHIAQNANTGHCFATPSTVRPTHHKYVINPVQALAPARPRTIPQRHHQASALCGNHALQGRPTRPDEPSHKSHIHNHCFNPPECGYTRQPWPRPRLKFSPRPSLASAKLSRHAMNARLPRRKHASYRNDKTRLPSTFHRPG